MQFGGIWDCFRTNIYCVIKAFILLIYMNSQHIQRGASQNPLPAERNPDNEFHIWGRSVFPYIILLTCVCIRQHYFCSFLAVTATGSITHSTVQGVILVKECSMWFSQWQWLHYMAKCEAKGCDVIYLIKGCSLTVPTARPVSRCLLRPWYTTSFPSSFLSFVVLGTGLRVQHWKCSTLWNNSIYCMCVHAQHCKHAKNLLHTSTYVTLDAASDNNTSDVAILVRCCLAK